MKHRKFTKAIVFLLVTAIPAFIPLNYLAIKILIGILALGAFGLLVYGLTSKKKFDKKIPTHNLSFNVLFILINLLVTRFILSAKSFNIEQLNENLFTSPKVFLITKIFAYLIIEGGLFFVIKNIAGKSADTAARHTLDSMNQKFFDIDNRLNSGEITDETATSLKDEVRIEIDYYSTIDGAMKINTRVFVISFLFSLVTFIGSIGIAFYTKTLTPDLTEQIMNYSIAEGITFSIIFSIAIIGLYSKVIKTINQQNKGGVYA